MRDTWILVNIELHLQDWYEHTGPSRYNERGQHVQPGRWTTRWRGDTNFWQVKAQASAGCGGFLHKRWQDALKEARRQFWLPHDDFFSPYNEDGCRVVAPRLLVWALWLKAYLGKLLFSQYEDCTDAGLRAQGYSVDGLERLTDEDGYLILPWEALP